MIGQCEADIQEHLRLRADRHAKMNMTAQPIIVVVCPAENTIASSFVCINNIKYKAHTLLRTLDLSFKIHMMLNCEYSVAAKNVYLFFQRYFFDVETPNDVMTTHVSSLLARMKQ